MAKVTHNDAETNGLLRKQFNEWWELTNKPNLTLVADDMGLNYYTLISWKTGKHTYGKASLSKVRRYFFKLQQRQAQVDELYNKII